MDNVEDIFRLTPTQEGMLVHVLETPRSGVYVEQLHCRLAADLAVENFRQAWEILFRRHGALRTIFLWEDVDEPLQVVRQQVSLPWRVETNPHGNRPDERAWWERCLAEDREAGFDLTQAPLSRFTLAQRNDGGWFFVWTFHHMILDGWSVAVLLEELRAVYEDLQRGKSVAVDSAPLFRDLVAWMAKQDSEMGVTFWESRLAGWSEAVSLKSYGSRGHGYCRLERALELTDVEALSEWARHHRLTMNSVVAGAWALVLHRLTGREDIVFGTTVSLRPPEIPGIEALVGCCVNSMPVRVLIQGDRRLVEWLLELQNRQAEAQAHLHVGLTEIGRRCPAARGGVLFDHVLVFENYPGSLGGEEEGLQLEDVDLADQSHFSFALVVVNQGGSLRLLAHFDRAAHDEAVVGHWLEILAQTLKDFLRTDLVLSELELLSGTQRQQLEDWSKSSGLSNGTESVVEMIQRRTIEEPNATAVFSGESSVSYAELDQLSNALAVRLTQAGIGAGDRVGLCVERSTEMIVGIVGILKAGCAYVPLEPDYPRERRAMLGREAAVRAVVAPRFLSLEADGITHVPIEELEVEKGIVRALDAPPPNSLAYVIFTSGSTGTPKGVGVTHANLAWSTRARLAHYKAPVERFLLLSPFSFDSAVAGIFWTLASGGALVLPAPGEERDIESLERLIERRQVTHLLGIPGLYELILGESVCERLGSLKLAIVAGEVCPSSLVKRHRACLPECELHNEYGPTEATVWCVAARLDDRESPELVPIGRPVPGVRVFVQNDQGGLLPPLMAGELVIGGPGVARGYVNSSTADKECFVADPDLPGEYRYKTGDLACWSNQGELLFLGRQDRQVKIRGYRVELLEIESVIRGLADVRDVVVQASQSGVDGSMRVSLVAYVEMVEVNQRVGADGIRESASERLPQHMVPGDIVIVSHFPRLPNGKVDYQALPALKASVEGIPKASEQRELSDMEAKLAAIWEDVLGMEGVLAGDNFYELGGDSLLCIRIASRAREVGFNLSPADFASDATLAELVAQGRGEEGTSFAVEQANEIADGIQTTAIQEWFFEQEFSVPGHWNQALVLHFPNGAQVPVWRDALREVLRIHQSLRTRFRKNDQGWLGELVADDEIVFERIQIESVPGSELRPRVLEVLENHQSLSLSDAVALTRVLIIEDQFDRLAAVGMIAHHLLVDLISWGTVAEDLVRSVLGSGVAIPQTTFPTWAEFVNQRARSEGGVSEIEFWCDVNRTPGGSLSRDFETDVLLERGRRSLSRKWHHADVDRLVSVGERRWRAQLEEVLIAGIAVILNEWTRGEGIRIGLEHHGRRAFLGGHDISRTVGWFTSFFPITIPRKGISDSVLWVKKTLRAVPDGGVGFGAIKYLSGNSDGALRLGEIETPEVSFNYQSRLTGGLFDVVASAPDGIVAELVNSRSSENAMPHLMEIDVVRESDGLTVTWYYHELAFKEETIHRLLTRLSEVLSEVLNSDPSSGAAPLSPEDFEDSDIDQADLDSLLDES